MPIMALHLTLFWARAFASCQVMPTVSRTFRVECLQLFFSFWPALFPFPILPSSSGVLKLLLFLHLVQFSYTEFCTVCISYHNLRTCLEARFLEQVDLVIKTSMNYSTVKAFKAYKVQSTAYLQLRLTSRYMVP